MAVKIDLTDLRTLDEFLYAAMQQAMKATELNIVVAKDKLNSITNRSYFERYQRDMEKPEYRRGLFVTALRRALVPLRSALTKTVGGHKFVDLLISTRSWKDYGQPDHRYTFDYDIVLDSDHYCVWPMSFNKIVDMCNGVWTPLGEPMASISDTPIESEIRDDIDNLERLNLVSLNLLNQFPAQIDRIKEVGNLATKRRKEIYE